MLFDIILSVAMYAVFGWIGIVVIKNNKKLQKFCNQKNLIILSIVYVLSIAVLFSGDPDASDRTDQILLSVGNYIATFVGALITAKILTKSKHLFNKEFYHSLSGSIVCGFILLVLAYGFLI